MSKGRALLRRRVVTALAVCLAAVAFLAVAVLLPPLLLALAFPIALAASIATAAHPPPRAVVATASLPLPSWSPRAPPRS